MPTMKLKPDAFLNHSQKNYLSTHVVHSPSLISSWIQNLAVQNLNKLHFVVLLHSKFVLSPEKIVFYSHTDKYVWQH